MIGLKLKVKEINIEAKKPIVVLHTSDAREIDVHAEDRVLVAAKGRKMMAIVDLTSETLKPGQLGIFQTLEDELKLKSGDRIEVFPTEKPVSIQYIKKKLNGQALSAEEIDQLVRDIDENKLSDVEMASFVAASYVRGFDMNETVALTNSIVNTGIKLDFGKGPIVDKHCIGGVPGNRTTPLVVSIVAAAGLTIPKTSSRSITAPSGTADTMEVIMPVGLGAKKIQEVVKKTGGCMVWGGAVNLAAADDKLIKIRHPLSLDPEGMLLASIMAKKKAVGSHIVLIDIPIGKGAKILGRPNAYSLASNFVKLGQKLDMKVECVITSGDHPIGWGIGPTLEAREIIRILGNEGGSAELREKGLLLSGRLLEVSGKAEEGQGLALASEILESGKANEKFREIIEAQGGDPDVRAEDLELAKYNTTVFSQKSGKIFSVNNINISRVARTSGSPTDNKAGILMKVEKGQYVQKGEPLFEIHAENKVKLAAAKELADKLETVEFSKIILGEYRV